MFWHSETIVTEIENFVLRVFIPQLCNLSHWRRVYNPSWYGSCTFQMRISPSDLCQWTSERFGDSLKVSSSSQKGTWSQFPGDSILIFSLFLPLRSMMLLLSLEIVIVPSFCLPTQWLNLDIFLDSSNLIESYITGKFIGNIYCPFSCSEDYMFPFSCRSN